MPSRKYFTENIIPDMYSTIKARLLQDIDGKFSISFTIDIWSHKASGDSFISWTAHYFKILTQRVLLERNMFSKYAHFVDLILLSPYLKCLLSCWEHGILKNLECTLSYVIMQLIWWWVSESVNYQLLVVPFIPYSWL